MCKGQLLRCLLLAVSTGSMLSLPATTEAAPKLGQPLAGKASGSITVWPDGRGLPAGSGNAAIGEKLYTSKCAACHGVDGTQGINAPLVGGQVDLTQTPSLRTVGSYWPYATALFDYIRRTMPYREPGSLTDNQVYALVAYLLVRNQLMEPELELDAERLRSIVMPNRARFYSEYELP